MPGSGPRSVALAGSQQGRADRQSESSFHRAPANSKTQLFARGAAIRVEGSGLNLPSWGSWQRASCHVQSSPCHVVGKELLRTRLLLLLPRKPKGGKLGYSGSLDLTFGRAADQTTATVRWCVGGTNGRGGRRESNHQVRFPTKRRKATGWVGGC